MHSSKATLLFCASLVAACAEVSNERLSTVTVNGKEYPVKTQTVQSGGRTFDVSRVRVENLNPQCDLSLSNDCEAVVKEVLSQQGKF